MKLARTLVLGLSVILLFSVFGYGFGAFYALGQLRFHSPTITVARQDWTIYVSLSIEIENPTDIPLPTFDAVFEAKLNNHVLCHDEIRSLGSLNPHSTVRLTVTIAVDGSWFSDLFWTLVDYLSGKPISYSIHLGLSFHFITSFQIYSKTMTGEFELY